MCIRTLPGLNETNPDNHTVCKNVRNFTTLMSLVLGLLDKLGFDGLRTFNLKGKAEI